MAEPLVVIATGSLTRSGVRRLTSAHLSAHDAAQRHPARLIDLCGEIGFPASWTFGSRRERLLPVNFHADPFSLLIGALMAGTLTSPSGRTKAPKTQIRTVSAYRTSRRRQESRSTAW